jgi:hypothetical protein
MRKKYDAVATIGEYTTKTGEKKKRYLTVGAVFEDEAGRLSFKLDGLPVGPEWSGWISFYEPMARPEQQEASRRRESLKPAPLEDEKEIPF